MARDVILTTLDEHHALGPFSQYPTGSDHRTSFRTKNHSSLYGQDSIYTKMKEIEQSRSRCITRGTFASICPTSYVLLCFHVQAPTIVFSWKQRRERSKCVHEGGWCITEFISVASEIRMKYGQIIHYSWAGLACTDSFLRRATVWERVPLNVYVAFFRFLFIKQ